MRPGAPRKRFAGDRLVSGLGDGLEALHLRMGNGREPPGRRLIRKPAVGDEADDGLEGKKLRTLLSGVLPVDLKSARICGGDLGFRLVRLDERLGERPLREVNGRPSPPSFASGSKIG